MEQADAKAAGTRAEAEEARWKDIHAGEVRAGGEALLFERVKLCGGSFSVMLPQSYRDLPIGLARLKYPAENRPAVIKTNADTTVNFAFAYYPGSPIGEGQIEAAVMGWKSGLGRIASGARIFDARFARTEGGVRLGWFDFLSPALDMETYQLFGFVPARGKLLHFIFNAPAALMRSWQPVAVQALQSVRDENPGEPEEGA